MMGTSASRGWKSRCKVWYCVLGLGGKDWRFDQNLRGPASWRLPALPGSCSSSSSRRSCGIGNGSYSGKALRALERELIDSPDKAPVIEQTGGLRKLRFAPPGSGRGRSGAYRVCYAYFPAYGTVALFVIFGKNERSDLSPAEARATAKALQAFEAELHREFEQQT